MYALVPSWILTLLDLLCFRFGSLVAILRTIHA
jgi:hypothetical protein